MAQRKPRTRGNGRYTESGFWSFIRSGLRSKYNKWPPKWDVLRDARRPCKKKGRQKWEYKCAHCRKHFPQKEVQVDHIVECGSLKSFDDLAGFVERLFCEKDNLQVLCTNCHKVKGNG